MGPPNTLKFKQGLRKAALEAKIAANAQKIGTPYHHMNLSHNSITSGNIRSKVRDSNESSDNVSKPLAVQVCANQLVVI